MNRIDKYKNNEECHRNMLQEMDQLLKIIRIKGGNMNNIYVEPPPTFRGSLSERFLTMLANVIDNNLQFLLFQTAKLSESLLETDKKEAIEECKNFINSSEQK